MTDPPGTFLPCGKKPRPLPQPRLRAYAGANRVDQPLISPIHGAFDASFPPFLITTGTRDLLLSQAVRLSQRLRDSGATVDLQVWEGLWHVFEWYEDLPEARQSIQRIADHLTGGMAAG